MVDDQGISRIHERHLQGYWPIFALGSVVEVAGYMFFHPDLFTLVVCVKTTGCLALWLSRRGDGSKVSGPAGLKDGLRPGIWGTDPRSPCVVVETAAAAGHSAPATFRQSMAGTADLSRPCGTRTFPMPKLGSWRPATTR